MEGKVPAEQLQEMISEFEEATEDGQLDADETSHLLEVINEAIGEDQPAETDST